MDETLPQVVSGDEPDAASRVVAEARRALATYKLEILCATILLALAFVLVAITARKSITADEIVLIPSAYYHLVTNDVQLIPQHPPLCKLLAGLPLLFLQPDEPQPVPVDRAATKDDLEWLYVSRFWQDNHSRFEAISFWTRMPMIALTVALGALTFVFARDLFGPRAALLAVALFALEPTVLAHGRVVQTDIPAAFGFLLTIFALYRYFRAPDWKGACGLGAAAGVAMLAKYSMVFLGPSLVLVFLALLVYRRNDRRAVVGHAFLAAAILVLVINAGYFFYHRELNETDSVWIQTFFPSPKGFVWASVRFLKLLLPTDFVMGVYWQLNHSHFGHPAGLLGMYSDHGWWYYFPVAFALKTTLPFLILSLCSLIWGTWAVIRKQQRWLLLLLVPFTVYTALMMATPINIGVRYYLPAYLFLFILSGGLLETWFRRRTSRSVHLLSTATGVVLLSVMVVETGRAYPNYMPYLNELAAAKPHWWYLSDSNVEWGDDVRELALYLRSRGETRVRAVLLGGFATLGFYGVNYEDAVSPASPPTSRYIAIGASFLNGSTVPPYELEGKRVSEEQRINTFATYRDRVPEAVIGNSIYVYRTSN
jgi:4-amino-4-deoxy-L-arabinose transferase-like glycosyltransferase